MAIVEDELAAEQLSQEANDEELTWVNERSEWVTWLSIMTQLDAVYFTGIKPTA